MKKSILLTTSILFSTLFVHAQSSISGPIVQTPVYFDISPPLRDMVNQAPTTAETSWKDGIVKNKFNVLPKPDAPIPGAWSDPNLQTTNGPLVTDTTIANFDGNNNTEGVYPPDTHGDVGPNHYFQVVNSHFSIYNKSGVKLLGPSLNSTIFSGMSNNSNDGCRGTV